MNLATSVKSMERHAITKVADSPSGRPVNTPTNWLTATRLFASYAERLVRKHFHSIRILGHPDLSAFKDRPLLIFANHPSWWDPLIALVVWRRLFPGRIPYAPIDAVAVEKYAFFKKLGFYGVERGTARGARSFLRISTALLEKPESLLMVTPQGRFADVRERSLKLEAGLGHLSRRTPHAVFVPLAIEYPFWEEKCPEVLLNFGEPFVNEHFADREIEHINRELEARLAKTQANLAAASINRDVANFNKLVGGRTGTNVVYDTWRRFKAMLRGESFSPAHGTK
ncbi:acyltransferase [bacterium]|nr:acyltransferase [bacterium]